MNWLGLSALQISGLFLASAAFAVWLYLHTRRPQRRVVSTLRFWIGVQHGETRQRRRISDPWALLAQLLFLLLLIVALGNPHWGSAAEARRVVMVLDTSVWSQVQPSGGEPWIAQTRREAQRLLDALPSTDEVMLISAEPDALPIMRSTTDHTALRKAIATLQASNSIANVPQALEIGKGALAESRRGLLVYVGPGMVDEEQTGQIDEFRKRIEATAKTNNQVQFLVRLAGSAAPIPNQGITRFTLRRDPAEPDLWHTLTQIKNYDAAKSTVSLKLSIGGQSFAEEKVLLGPGELANAENQFEWPGDGIVQADISTPDALDADNHAAAILRAFRPAQVALIGTDSPFSNDVLTSMVSNPYLQVELVRPGGTPQSPPDVAIYESANPPSHVEFNSIWFLKGKGAAGSRRLRLAGWNEQHPVTRWVRTRDVSVRNPSTLAILPGDTVLATVDGDPTVPLIVAREMNGHRIVIVGFDPDDSDFTQQAAFPLMMAGCIEWMSRPVEESAESFSAGEIEVPGPATRIIAPSGRNMPFASDGPNVHLLATESGSYRVLAPSGEANFFVNLPLLPAHRLEPTALEMSGIESEPPVVANWELWRWLAGLAVFALWLEWWLYYSSRRKQNLPEGLEPFVDGKSNSYSDLGQTPVNSEARPPSLRI
jgi:hypothetical protein